jgi:hypothetical protein
VLVGLVEVVERYLFVGFVDINFDGFDVVVMNVVDLYSFDFLGFS